MTLFARYTQGNALKRKSLLCICQGFDLLLGSDVAYSLKALPSLFAAAAKLLSRKPQSVFLLGYVSRCCLLWSLQLPSAIFIPLLTLSSLAACMAAHGAPQLHASLVCRTAPRGSCMAVDPCRGRG